MSDHFLSKQNIASVYRYIVQQLNQNGKIVDDTLFYPTFHSIVNSIYPKILHLDISEQNSAVVHTVLGMAGRGNANVGGDRTHAVQDSFNDTIAAENDNSDVEARYKAALKSRESNLLPHTNEDLGVPSIPQIYDIPAPEPRRLRAASFATAERTNIPPFKRTRRTILSSVGVNKVNVRNVHALRLISAIIPNNEYTISTRNNRLYFKESIVEDTWMMVEIEEGNYSSVKDVIGSVIAAMNREGKCTYRYVIDGQTGRVSIFCNYQESSPDDALTTPTQEDLPRLPGGSNSQYIPNTFQICFGSSDLYAEQSNHLGNILGFESPQVYTGLGVCVYNKQQPEAFTYSIEAQHPAHLHEHETVVVKIDEIPDMTVLVPLHHQKGRGYFYCPKYTHRIQIGHYENIPTHEHILPNLGNLTLRLMTTKNEVFNTRGSSPTVEIEIESIEFNH